MRSRYLLALVALAALVLVLSAQPGPVSASHNAPRTFVSTTGNDTTNPCSAAAPCRTFAVAIGHTAAGGEIVAIDSGGYGPVTITKSVAIVGAPGAHVAITATSGNAISVAAGTTDRVILRNLYLTGIGAGYGVNFTSGAALHVENVVASGFSVAGINVDNPGTSETFISDSVVRSNLEGIEVQSNVGLANATIVRTRAESNATGVSAHNRARVIVRDTVSTGNGFYGFACDFANVSCQMSIEHSTSSMNGTGVFADLLAVIDVSNSTISYNGVGVHVSANDPDTARVDVSNSTITYNGTGINTGTWGQAFSRVNNTLEHNTTNGAFTGTITAK